MFRDNLGVLCCDRDGCDNIWLPGSDRRYRCDVCSCDMCEEHSDEIEVSACFITNSTERKNLDVPLVHLDLCFSCIDTIRHALYIEPYRFHKPYKDLCATSIKASLTEMARAKMIK